MEFLLFLRFEIPIIKRRTHSLSIIMVNKKDLWIAEKHNNPKGLEIVDRDI
jgi:hypothetical protein